MPWVHHFCDLLGPLKRFALRLNELIGSWPNTGGIGTKQIRHPYRQINAGLFQRLLWRFGLDVLDFGVRRYFRIGSNNEQSFCEFLINFVSAP